MSQLREIQIVLPDLPLEASFKFNSESCSTVALFQRFLPKIETNKIGKLVLTFFSEKKEQYVQGNRLGAICVYHFDYDVSAYPSFNNQQKKEFILKLLMFGLKPVSKKENLDFTVFEKAGAKVIEASYKNEELLGGKAKFNRKKTHKAQVKCIHEVDSYTMIMTLLDKDEDLIAEQTVVQAFPRVRLFYPYLGKLKWINGNEVVLYDRVGGVIHSMSILA